MVDGIRSFSWRIPSCPTRLPAPVQTPLPRRWVERLERFSAGQHTVAAVGKPLEAHEPCCEALISGARVGFIGLYRDEETLEAVEYYVKLPNDIAARNVILLDPMLATGNSTASAIGTVKRAGATNILLIALIAAPEGIEHIVGEHPDVRIVVASIDRNLNEKGYIVPGLGDAGDRLYGTK